MSSDKCLNMLDIPLISLVYEYDAESVNVYTRTGAGWTQLGGSRCGQLCACAVRSLGWREIGQQLAAGSPRSHNIAINTDTCRVTVRRYVTSSVFSSTL